MAKMRTKFHIIQAKLIMFILCFTVQCVIRIYIYNDTPCPRWGWSSTTSRCVPAAGTSSPRVSTRPGTSSGTPVGHVLSHGVQSTSRRFVASSSTWSTGPGLLEVAVYPYGNAHQTQNKDGSWNFTCQHDKPECDGNLIEVTTLIIRTLSKQSFKRRFPKIT